VLDALFAAASDDAEIRRKTVSELDLEKRIAELDKPVSAITALSAGPQIKIIAEIKRASPSMGELAAIDDVALLAKTYQAAGAHAISVLTERTGFKGSLADLKTASDSVNIPTLRKDFISSEYQLLEARANGASFALLILSWLTEADYRRLANFAHDIGLDVLTETHTISEIEIANNCGANLVGINTRNLETFKTDLSLFESMAHLLSDDAIKVAESSVRDEQDVLRYWNAGANAVLVGQALVTGDPAQLIPKFIDAT